MIRHISGNGEKLKLDQYDPLSSLETNQIIIMHSLAPYPLQYQTSASGSYKFNVAKIASNRNLFQLVSRKKGHSYLILMKAKLFVHLKVIRHGSGRT